MNVEAPPRKDTGPSAPIGSDPRPVVALPNAGLPGIAIAAIMAICALILFLVLDGQRRRAATEPAEASQMQTGSFAAPPPLAIPPEPAPAPPPPVVTIPVFTQPAPAPQPRVAPPPPPMIMPIAPPPMVSQAPARPQVRTNEPALIFDAGGPSSAEVNVQAPPQPQVRPGGPQQQQQQQRAGRGLQPPARPTRIANQSTVVPTGTLIRAVLETPIDTARPGLARAIVSKDARGFDGQRVLIPRGSRLIGEYESEVRTGQNKVLVNWIQLVRPDGTTIRLDSPAADAMGGAGVPGRVNTFFFQRFFNAVLQTALTVGGSLATYSSDAPVIVGLPNSAVTNVAGQGGLIGQTPQPKITVKQGTTFNVFVARDLDFSGAPLRK